MPIALPANALDGPMICASAQCKGSCIRCMLPSAHAHCGGRLVFHACACTQASSCPDTHWSTTRIAPNRTGYPHTKCRCSLPHKCHCLLTPLHHARVPVTTSVGGGSYRTACRQATNKQQTAPSQTHNQMTCKPWTTPRTTTAAQATHPRPSEHATRYTTSCE